MVAEGDRERLRVTFDAAADLYHRARPDYPDALFDDIVAETGLRAGDRVLEIGCATGKATVGLVARDLRVTCVEMGEHLAERARANLGDAAEVITGHFEQFDLGTRAPFDLVAAATSWHWLDPALRCGRAASVLRDGGHLATWGAGHVIPEGGDPFFEEIQEVYAEIGEGLPPGVGLTRPHEVADDAGELDRSGYFDVVFVRRYDWEIVYDAESYIDLLNTFSGHIAMEPWQRDRLFGEIRRRLALRPDGLLRRHWGGALTIARKR